MNIPWYVYILVLLVGAVAGVVAFFAGLDPEGRGLRVRAIAVKVDHLAVAGLLILVVLEVAGWLRR